MRDVGLVRCHRLLWTPVAGLVLVFAWTVGLRDPGWLALVVGPAFLGTLGAYLRYEWVSEGADRARGVAAWGLGTAAATSLLIGLTPSLGLWSPVVLALLAVSEPGLVERGRGWLRRRRPLPGDRALRAWSDDELEHRWRTSAAELRSERTTPDRALVLVQDRARVLDEIERRDPARFHARLARAGWQVSET